MILGLLPRAKINDLNYFDYEQVQENYERLLEKCASLLMENFELKKSR